MRNSLGLIPVLMQPVKKKYLTKQCSAGQVHSNRLDTLSGRLWHLPPTFPQGSLVLQDTSCPPWLSPCSGPAAHQGVCAPDRSSSTPAVEQTRCTSCLACVCWSHKAPWKQHSLCADPHTGQSKLPGLCSDCFWLARKAAMDGCWAMIDASRMRPGKDVSRKGCIQERIHPGKDASRGDLVLQPPGQAALLSWGWGLGFAVLQN